MAELSEAVEDARRAVSTLEAKRAQLADHEVQALLQERDLLQAVVARLGAEVEGPPEPAPPPARPSALSKTSRLDRPITIANLAVVVGTVLGLAAAGRGISTLPVVLALCVCSLAIEHGRRLVS